MNDAPPRPSFADRLYLALTVWFATCVVVSNLLFQKFLHFSLPFYGPITISAGLIIYPATFLLMDIIIEVYGKRHADLTIKITFFTTLFALLFVRLIDALPAASWSPVNDALFHRVFGATDAAFIASLISYMVVQHLDIRLFLWIKKLSQGRHLWLRNNVSTMLSQTVDTFTVLSILCLFNLLTPQQLPELFLSSLSFKIAFALADTPFFYAAISWVRHKDPALFLK